MPRVGKRYDRRKGMKGSQKDFLGRPMLEDQRKPKAKRYQSIQTDPDTAVNTTTRRKSQDDETQRVNRKRQEDRYNMDELLIKRYNLDQPKHRRRKRGSA